MTFRETRSKPCLENSFLFTKVAAGRILSHPTQKRTKHFSLINAILELCEKNQDTSGVILSCRGTSCGRQGEKSVLSGSMNFGLTTGSQTEACQTDVSLLHLKSIFRVHTGVSYTWKALSKAGGFGDLCCKVKKKGMGTSLEKHLPVQNLKS